MPNSKLSKTEQKPPAVTKINEDDAITETNGFLLEHFPDRFCAGVPRLVSFPARTVWAVPILLSYPAIGPVGEVGMVAVDTETGNVVGWTPISEVMKAADQIYSEKKEEIEAAFS